MTTTQKKQQKFLPFSSELPMPGTLSTYAYQLNHRHGTAWDLRSYDGKGEPPVKIIKGNNNVR